MAQEGLGKVVTLESKTGRGRKEEAEEGGEASDNKAVPQKTEGEVAPRKEREPDNQLQDQHRTR